MTYRLRRPVLLLALATAALGAGCADDIAPPTDAAPKDTAPKDTAVDKAPDVATPATPDASAPDVAGQPDAATLADASPDTAAVDALVPDAAEPADAEEVVPDAPPPADDAAPDAEPEPQPVDAAPDSPPAPLMGPLLGHWTFDDLTGTTAADTSPNAEPATLSMGAAFSASGFPTAAFANPGAAVLDGVTAFVELPTRPFLTYQTAKTISVWFNPTTPAKAGRQNLVALTSDEGGIQMGLDAGRPTVWLANDANALILGTTPVTAAWHHFAYSWDGTTHRLYVDGQLINTSVTPALGTVPGVVRLGAFDLTTENFGGSVDDLRLYDSALDITRIAALAAGQN
jgi:hypothetical protein